MTSDSPLVTVIIPSFNHELWVAEAIDSVLNQTYPNKELIVVDDGSTDSSASVIEKYAKQNLLTAIYKQQNLGQSHSLNLALRIARGDLVCFLPSDDWFLPTKLAIQVERFLSLSSEYGVVYGKGYNCCRDTLALSPTNLPVYEGDIFPKLLSIGNFIFPATPMFRKSVFIDYAFDESFMAEGESIYVKIAQSYKFSYVDEPLAVMRAHSYNTGINVPMMYSDNIRWWSNFRHTTIRRNELNQVWPSLISRLHRLYGLSALFLYRNQDMSYRALTACIKVSPRCILDPKVVISLILSCLPSWVLNWVLVVRRRLK